NIEATPRRMASREKPPQEAASPRPSPHRGEGEHLWISRRPGGRSEAYAVPLLSGGRRCRQGGWGGPCLMVSKPLWPRGVLRSRARLLLRGEQVVELEPPPDHLEGRVGLDRVLPER